MAYEFAAHLISTGLSDKQPTWTYRIFETDVQTGSEWSLDLPQKVGSIPLYQAEITDDAGATVLTLAPTLGTAAAFVENTNAWITSNGGTVPATAEASIRNADAPKFYSRSGKLFGRSGPNANGGEIETYITIAAG